MLLYILSIALMRYVLAILPTTVQCFMIYINVHCLQVWPLGHVVMLSIIALGPSVSLQTRARPMMTRLLSRRRDCSLSWALCHTV
jgi:hypothetical protein